MLPDHVLSTTPVPGYFLIPDNREPDPLIDYEMGGVALFDPSQGLQVQVWWARCEVDGVKETSSIYIGADNVPEVLFFSSEGSFTEVGLAFDQNMNPFIAFVEDGVAKFYWYDTNVAGYVTTVLPEGSRSPRCCLDDKRPMEIASSDILLFYMKGEGLYLREQRDRYEVEYELATGLGTQDVLVAGMARHMRVQIGLGLQDYPAGTVNYRGTVNGRRRITVDGKYRRLVKVSYG